MTTESPEKVVLRIEEMPELDDDLKKRVKSLSKDGLVGEFGKTVREWQRIIIIRNKELEHRSRSHRLDPLFPKF